MKNIRTAVILFLPIFILYMGWFDYGFISIDDDGQVLKNTSVRNITFENLKTIFTSSTVSMYQPLTSLFFAFIIALTGLKSALSFHIFSFLLHYFNTLLVYRIGKRIIVSNISPYILALLFAVHPLSVEAVAWVSATSTLLFTLFFLLATLNYSEYLDKKKPKHYYLSLLFFTIGGFAKIQILPFVGVLFLLEYLKGKPFTNQKYLLNKIPFLIVAALLAYITLQFRGGQQGFPYDNYKPIFLFTTQLAWYPYKLFIPLNLGIVYDWPLKLFTPWFYISILLLLVSSYLVYRNRKNKLFVFGILFYLFNIILHTAIFSNFLGPYSNRYAYISTLGIWIALISLIKKERVFAFNLLGFILIVIYASLAKIQTTYWKDTITLWTTNLKHQKSTFSNGMRGNLYYEKKMYPEAKADFEKVDKNPDPRFEPEKYSYLYTALGMMTKDTNPLLSASYFSKSAYKYPIYGNIENAGIAYRKIKNYDKAEEYFLKCLEIAQYPKAFVTLGSLYFETKEFDKGIHIMTRAIEMGLNEVIFYKMRCFFRIQEKQFELAAQDYRKAVEINAKNNPNKPPDSELQQLKQNLKDYLN